MRTTCPTHLILLHGYMAVLGEVHKLCNYLSPVPYCFISSRSKYSLQHFFLKTSLIYSIPSKREFKFHTHIKERVKHFHRKVTTYDKIITVKWMTQDIQDENTPEILNFYRPASAERWSRVEKLAFRRGEYIGHAFPIERFRQQRNLIHMMLQDNKLVINRPTDNVSLLARLQDCGSVNLRSRNSSSELRAQRFLHCTPRVILWVQKYTERHM
jgi:hypothetical protein